MADMASGALELLDRLTNEDGSLEITRIPEAALGKEIGRFMRQMRLKAGLRRIQVAERLGITKREVRRLERGIPAEELSLTTTALFAHACGYTLKFRISAREGEERETVFEI